MNSSAQIDVIAAPAARSDRRHRPAALVEATRMGVARQTSPPRVISGVPSPAPNGLHRHTTPSAVVLPSTSLRLDRQISFDKWLGIGQHLAAVASTSAWCLGDWLIYGETRFAGRYRSAIEQTSLEYKTLRNYAWVARKFPPARRRGNLSFGHHAEIAGLPDPEQDYWLHKAESFSWSRNILRREVRASLAERGESLARPDVEPEPTRGNAAGHEDAVGGQVTRAAELYVELTSDQLAMITEAASKAELTVAEWAPLVLAWAAQVAWDPTGNGAAR